MKREILVTLLAASTGCATYSSFRCPEPIGDIVRQDCDDYRVRYESLAAKISFSIGTVQVGAELGQEKLRDPSELVQMMMQQMLALCHDYNACRISNSDYQRRREEADRVFTAVMALAEQLKNPALEQNERKRLIDDLLVLLGARQPAPAPTAPPAAKPKAEITAAFFREPWSLWFEGRHLPPLPPPEKEGVPRLVRAAASGGGLDLFFYGPAEEDDVVVLSDGTRCPVKVQKKEKSVLARAECKCSGSVPPALGLRYVPGSTGRAVELAEPADLKDSYPRAWLAYQPEPLRQDPIEGERPYLILEGKGKGVSFISARCSRDGKPVTVEGTRVLKAGSNSGGAGNAIWYRAIELPWELSYSGKTESSLTGGPAGKWSCTVSFDGKPALEVGFEITAAGVPRPHQTQQGRAGDRASPWWLLETRLSGE